MARTQSEQLPNDGSYHIKRLVNEANARLKQIGKQGKRATIVAKKTSLSLQFTFKDGDGNSQKNVGLGAILSSPKGILEAEKIAQLVTGQLVAGTFSWDWYNSLIGKDTSEKTQVLTCKEMLEQYKKHYFKQREGNKNPDGSWYKECNSIESVLGDLEKPISLLAIRQIVESKKNNSVARAQLLNGLVGLLKYFGNTDYKKTIEEYKANNNPKRNKRNVPSDNKIIEVFKTGFKPAKNTSKKFFYRLPQWQFLYGLLATYGLRVHEAWHIANWDKPVTLKNGDWVAVDMDENNELGSEYQGEDETIPAILDPSNEKYLLCIKHDTKTGYRVAAPLSPESHNWIKEFNLLQPLSLPDIKDPLERLGRNKSAYNCTCATCNWFTSRKYGFKPHDLRHAYNHRGYQSEFNPKALADSLGHSVTMNSTGYLRHMSDRVKLKGIKDAISKEQNKRSELELLRDENKALKSQVEALKTENELLKTKLQLNKTIAES